MQCPVCNVPMIVLEYESVEVDYCARCRGVWLDAGELELLFGDVAACNAFMSGGDPSQAKGEKPRRCPLCNKKMAKDVTDGGHPVVYDRCKRGDGLWFDKGELTAVLAHGVSHEGGEHVARFLREIFPD